MSLVLDSEVIWTSDLLEPGMAFEEIELDRPLDAGEYKDVLLKYDCFSLKDQHQFNKLRKSPASKAGVLT